MKLKDLIEKIPLSGIEIVGDENKEIEGAAEFFEATPSHISFAIRKEFIDSIPQCQAGALIVHKDFSDFSENRCVFILHEEPYLLWAYVLKVFEPADDRPWEISPLAKLDASLKLPSKVRIGEFSVIESGVELGEGVDIGAQVYIGKDVKIGKGTKIYPQAVIREGTIIGDNCIIHSGVIIGSDGFGYVEDRYNGKIVKIPQIGIVEIGNNVEIGANTTIDRAVIGRTKIGDDTKIDNLVQIGHNVRIGKKCLIVAQVGVSGSTRIEDFVKIAGQSGIVGHLTIGEGAIIVARSVVVSAVPPGEIYSGYPAKPHSLEKRIKVSLKRLPEMVRYFSDLKKVKALEKLSSLEENEE